MNKDVKITAEQLRQAVCGDMEKLLDEVTVQFGGDAPVAGGE